MKRIIGILLVLFLVVAMVPSAGFCEVEDGAGAAGTAAGGAATGGVSTGTIVLGVVIAAVVVTGVAVALGGGGGDDAVTPTPTHP